MPSSRAHLDTLPIRDRVRSTLRDSQLLVTRFFHAIQSVLSGSTTLSPTELLQKVLSRLQELRGLINDLAEHQRLNAEIERLTAENNAEEAKLAALSNALREGETELQSTLDEHMPTLSVMHRANKRPINVDEVVSYGSKIAATIAAPPGWDPTQPLGNYLPPAPSEEMMRSGRLAASGADTSARVGAVAEDTPAQIVS